MLRHPHEHLAIPGRGRVVSNILLRSPARVPANRRRRTVRMAAYTPAHALDMERRLAGAELQQHDGLSASAGMWTTIAASAPGRIYTLTMDGRPECIFGIVLSPEAAHPWLHVSTVAMRHLRPIVWVARRLILIECPELRPVVRLDLPVAATRLRRFAVRLGFQETGTHTVDGLPMPLMRMELAASPGTGRA